MNYWLIRLKPISAIKPQNLIEIKHAQTSGSWIPKDSERLTKVLDEIETSSFN